MPDSLAYDAKSDLQVDESGPTLAPPPAAWPLPPVGNYGIPPGHDAAAPCAVQMPDGRIARADMVGIDFRKRIARIILPGEKKAVGLPFGNFLSLTLTVPLVPSYAGQRMSRQASDLLERRPRIPYRLQLKGAHVISGESVGYVENSAGLFLYPLFDDGDRIVRVFLPEGAYGQHELGKPIGRVLVEQNAISAEQVEKVAALQEEMRTQKLGEMLIKHQIVTPGELFKALEMQAHTPVMRVGEALIALGLIRQEQLDAVLELQKSDRSVPIGELLVRQKMITREDLRGALARKMGYPVVDVAQFPIELEALKRVPYAVAQRLHVLPLVLSDAALVVAMEDVTRHTALDELEFVAQIKVMPALASQQDIDRVLRGAYARIGEGDASSPLSFGKDGEGDGAPGDVGELAERLERDGADAGNVVEDKPIEQSDNSLVRLINQIIAEAYAEGASDVHIECAPGREKVKIRFRSDGRLRPYLELPHNYRNAIVSRIKVMCDLDISERRKPQDGKIDFSRFMPQHKLELRVATIPTMNGLEDVVLRLLASAKPIPLDELRLSEGNLARFKSMIEHPYGLVLCVGPTGSGKTTSLHSALGEINRPERKIWTAEDPVEITQSGLRQVQVNPKIDWTFARALRAFLRADPDVIMVGEVRDRETAQMVVEASLTGHLVFSTLHTNTAPETVTRLLDMGLDAFNFADALIGVLAQRLVRATCRDCRKEKPATQAQIDELLTDYLNVPAGAATPEQTRDSVLADWHIRFAKDGQLMLSESSGCKRCGGSGMRGRLGIHELMGCDRELRRLIQTRTPAAELQAYAMRHGMRTLRQDGIEKVLQGLTTIEEVRATSNEG